MKKQIKFFAVAGSFVLLSAFTIKNVVSWEISKNFSVKFTSKDPSGVFTKMDGDIVFDEAKLADAKFDLRIDVNSINTGNGMKNKHAKSDKWFDAEKFPQIQFTSKSFSKEGNAYSVKGTMKVHGIEKTFDIPFTFNNQTFKASFPVNRNDFKIGEAGAKVPAIMNVEVEIPVTKK